jgi:thioredoxin-like negative regulator of GroEL
LLDFWQESCRPCHALEPRLAAFARAHRRDLRAYRVDVADTPRRFGVMSLPAVLVLRDGHELARLDGLITNDDLERAPAQASAVSAT